MSRLQLGPGAPTRPCCVDRDAPPEGSWGLGIRRKEKAGL